MEMMTIRSVVDVPSIEPDKPKFEVKTFSRFTDAERQDCERQLNAAAQDRSVFAAQATPRPVREDWRFLHARYGRCRLCHKPFERGAVILWNVFTNETLHPKCCATKYPMLMLGPQPSASGQMSPPSRGAGGRPTVADAKP